MKNTLIIVLVVGLLLCLVLIDFDIIYSTYKYLFYINKSNEVLIPGFFILVIHLNLFRYWKMKQIKGYKGISILFFHLVLLIIFYLLLEFLYFSLSMNGTTLG